MFVAAVAALAKEAGDSAVAGVYLRLPGWRLNLLGNPDVADIVLDLVGMALAVPAYFVALLWRGRRARSRPAG